MKSSLLHKLLSEWERTLLAVIAIVACLTAGLALLDYLADDEMTIQTNNTIPPMPNYLNRSPEDALETPSAHLPPEAGNPFAFEKATVPKPPPKQQQQQNQNQPPKQQQQQNQNQPPKQQQQQNQNQPPKQQGKNSDPPANQPPPHTLTVTYRGIIETGDQKKMAFLTTVDSVKKQTNTLTLPPGANILPKVTVISADQKELIINAGGNTITIPNGGKSTFQIE